MRRFAIIFSLSLLLFPCAIRAQLAAPSHIAFQAALLPADARAGEGAQIVISARIDPGYHLYSLTQPDGGPQRTLITIPTGSLFSSALPALQPPYRSLYDSGFKITDQVYEQGVSFAVPVTIKRGLSGLQRGGLSIHYQLCTDKNCLIPATVQIPFSFTPVAGPARKNRLKPVLSLPPQPAAQNKAPISPSAITSLSPSNSATSPSVDAASRRIDKAEQAGLLEFLALAVGAGFLALLTPCVFPMIPITVSFFAKRSHQSRKRGVLEAAIYCLGIIATFTVLGVATSVIFKATGIRIFANNPVVNLALAVLFAVLGINLMGGFEIALPTSLVNRFSSGSSHAGLLTPFLMGLTFTLTSFTCTVAFVGTLLAAAAKGSIFYPIIGMLAFSSAFALPFFLLALFPQYLSQLPRSGAWMVTVKGFMGFVELAAALKFLSNADLAWNLDWLTRPVFLAVWAGLAAAAGCYLIGWIRLPHDQGISIGWTRRIIGGLSLLSALLLLGGMNGVKLGKLADFFPPDPYPGQSGKEADNLTWIHNYKRALAQAKLENRDLFINFTGVNCTNCRDMEQNVFPKPEVSEELNHFVLAELFTDRSLPDDQRHAALLQKLTGVATLPVYVVLSPDGALLGTLQDRQNPHVFLQFLKSLETK